MTSFEDRNFDSDTPRLVVTFKNENGNEMFQWGVAGNLPLLTVIGFITKIQSDVYYKDITPCSNSSLVIVWDKSKNDLECFLDKSIPVHSLVGMLETIKFTLMATNVAKAHANQQVILGPNGRPASNNIRRGF